MYIFILFIFLSYTTKSVFTVATTICIVSLCCFLRDVSFMFVCENRAAWARAACSMAADIVRQLILKICLAFSLALLYVWFLLY